MPTLSLSLLNLRANFEESTKKRNAIGGWTRSWSPVASAVPCSIQEIRRDATELIEAGKDTDSFDSVLYANMDARMNVVLQKIRNPDKKRLLRVTVKSESEERVFNLIGGYDTGERARFATVRLRELSSSEKRN